MLALALALLAQDWQYVPDQGFVDRRTLERRSPSELLDRGVAAREKGDWDEAQAVFAAVAAQAPEPALRERALWESARTRMDAGEFYDAYHALREYVIRFPQSPRAQEAKRLEMLSALELARKGHKKSVLGLRIFSTSKTGIDLLRESLRRYPREDFAADFVQRLGMYFYREGEHDLAAAEFQHVLDQYPDAPEVVLALYMLGMTAEQRFDGIERDIKPMRDARRLYERFLEESGRMRRLPDPAPRWVDELSGTVRDRLSKVYGLLHEKTLLSAEYYDWKGLPRSARFYYVNILRDEASFRRVLPDLPAHPAVTKARERVSEGSK